MGSTSRLPDQARPIRILIADDHALIRKMVRNTLEQHPHFEVCAEVEDGVSAIEKAVEQKPDVVILNVVMPNLNGFDAAREIKARVPESAIVILSSHADRGFLEVARKLGVQAYVAKSKTGEMLVKAVEAAVRGEDFVVLD